MGGLGYSDTLSKILLSPSLSPPTLPKKHRLKGRKNKKTDYSRSTWIETEGGLMELLSSLILYHTVPDLLGFTDPSLKATGGC